MRFFEAFQICFSDLKMAGLLNLFPTYDNLPEAIASLRDH
jgi:hypothetical protein